MFEVMYLDHSDVVRVEKCKNIDEVDAFIDVVLAHSGERLLKVYKC